MSASFLSPEEWLVRSSLAGGVLLLVGALLMFLTPQPARRQRLGELALLCSLLVAGLCALPAWSPWSLPLWSEAPVERTELLTVQMKPDQLATTPEDADLSFEHVYALNADLTTPEARPSAQVAETLTPATTSYFWEHSLPWFVTAYVVMTGFLLIRCGLGYIGLRRMWQSSVAPPRHVDRMMTNFTLGWRRVPRIGVSPRVPLPVSFGLWRPTILIPVSFCHLGRQDDLRQVLVHELTHLKRLDSWSCLLVALGQSLYFHLPWFWWVRKQVRLCQEYVADAAAASVTSSEDYAEYLVSLSGCAAPRLPVGAHVMGVKDKNSDLYRRVTMLLNASQSVENRPPRWWSVLTAGAFFAVAVLISGVGLRATAHADESKTEKEIVLHVIDDIDAHDAEIVVVRPDPTDEDKFILVSPDKANVKWVQDMRPFLGDEDGKRFVWTADDKHFVWTAKEPAQGKWVFSAQADSKNAKRFTVLSGAADGDKKVIVVGPDGKVEGKGVQVIEGKDGKRIIIIVDTSASVEEVKKLGDKKEPIRQIIERKVKVAEPKADAEKQKQSAEEAFKKAMESAKKARGQDTDAARKAYEGAWMKKAVQGDIIEKQVIEDVRKALEKHVSKEEMEHIQKALEAYRKAVEDKADKDKKQLTDFYKRVEVDQSKLEEAVRKAKEAAAGKVKEGEAKGKEAAAAAAAKAKEAEAKAREVEANLRYRAAKALTETAKAKGEGAKAGGGKLGVSIGSPSESLIAQLDLPKGQGIVIESVIPDSPAAKAGFQPHDVLVEFNGQPVASEPEALVKAIAELKAGSKIDAVVLRKGKRITVRGIVLADAGKSDSSKVEAKEAKPGQYKFEFKGLENPKLPKQDLEKLQLELKQLPKIELEKLEVQLKKLEDLKLPKEQLEKLQLELKQLPKFEIKHLKEGDLKELVIPKGELELIKVETPRVRAGQALQLLSDGKTARSGKTPLIVEAIKADGKRVTITMNRDNDKFTGKYDQGSLSITVTGTVKDGKVAVEAIVVKENDKEDKYGSVEKAPEKLRARVKRLIELAEKGKVDFKIEE